MRPSLVAFALGLTLAAHLACSRSPPKPDPTTPTSPAPPSPTPPSPTRGTPCGLSPSDWCTSAGSDPCGAHPDERSCRADPRCKGLPYRGESVVACMPDNQGFWSNCPAVGCVSR